MTQHHDYVVLGAGPAGLQLGAFLKENNRDYLILERGDQVGTFFRSFPRHRKLISINKVNTGINDPEINLRWDWNSLLGTELTFPKYSQKYFPDADCFLRYLNDFSHGLNIKRNSNITRIEKNNDLFTLENDGGNIFTCNKLIIATGLSIPKMPTFAGAEFVESYSTISTNPEDFRNQKVLIIGKGNSGFETAESIIETAAAIFMISPSTVRMAWKTHYVGDVRAVNNNLLDTDQLKSQNAVLNGNILSITKRGGQLNVSFQFSGANGICRTLVVDRAIACTGFRFDAAPFHAEARPHIIPSGKYPEMTSAWESVNVPSMYFVGTLMHMRDYRKTFSGFVHGFRYNVKALSQIFENRYHGGRWPAYRIELSPKTLFDEIMKRLHENSALFQQPGFIVDIFKIKEGAMECINEIPVDLINETLEDHHVKYFVLTMEYGHDEQHDPFSINEATGHFIHPVVRYVEGSNTIEEHNVQEDIESNFYKDACVIPLREFLERVLGNVMGYSCVYTN